MTDLSNTCECDEWSNPLDCPVCIKTLDAIDLLDALEVFDAGLKIVNRAIVHLS